MDFSEQVEQKGTETEAKSTMDTKNKLVEAMTNAVNIVVKKVLSKTDYSSFKKFYPEIALDDPEFLKNCHSQLCSQLEINFREDLDSFFSEHFLDKKLTELNVLIESEKTDEKNTWRPSGDPNEDIRDHRCKSKQKHLIDLQNTLQHSQVANDELEKTLQENHTEILNIKRRVFDIDQQNQTKLNTLTENQLSMMEELLSVAEEL